MISCIEHLDGKSFRKNLRDGMFVLMYVIKLAVSISIAQTELDLYSPLKELWLSVIS